MCTHALQMFVHGHVGVCTDPNSSCIMSSREGSSRPQERDRSASDVNGDCVGVQWQGAQEEWEALLNSQWSVYLGNFGSQEKVYRDQAEYRLGTLHERCVCDVGFAPESQEVRVPGTAGSQLGS